MTGLRQGRWFVVVLLPPGRRDASLRDLPESYELCQSHRGARWTGPALHTDPRGGRLLQGAYTPFVVLSNERVLAVDRLTG